MSHSMLREKVTKAKTLNSIYLPEFYYLSDNNCINDFNKLLEDPAVTVFDELSGQLKELLKSRNPKQRLTPSDYDALIEQQLAGRPAEEYGVWVYYPWSRRLVHILDRDEFIELRTAANRNKITIKEREILASKKVGVIGLSVGQSVSLTLAMERGCGELRIADFDTLELNNLNRIRSGVHNLGLLKAYMVAREIAEIDPFFKVTCYTEGISEDNIHDFFTRDGKLDAVIDECDGVNIKILCRIKAKELSVPVLMEASDRGTMDVERFDLEPDRPIIHGWLEHLPIDFKVLNALKTSEEKLPYILPIAGIETISPRMKASMMEIEQTLTTWPQLATAVTLGGAITADTCRRIFLDQFHDSGRYFIDMEDLVKDKEAAAKPVHEIVVLPGTTADDMSVLIASAAVSLSGHEADPGHESVQTMIAAAISAPSGGNAQPWKWKYHNKCLYLFIHSEYGPKLIDRGDMASFIGLGAATENLVLKAHELGFEVLTSKFPLGQDSKLVAVFQFFTSDGAAGLTGLENHTSDSLAASIPLRIANRKVVDRVEIEAAKLQVLTDSVRSVPGCDLRLLTDPAQIAGVAEVIARADRMRIMDKDGHLEFLAETRWTTEEAEKSKKGIDINSLDLTPSERVGVTMAGNWDVIDYLNKWNGGGALERLSRKAALAASAVGLITAPAYTKDCFFDGGRAVERVWLTATQHHIAFQPMSVSTFLFGRMLNETSSTLSDKFRNELSLMRQDFERIFSIDEKSVEILLFRVFIAAQQTGRSLRTSVGEILYF